jgi:hypothetical protein
MSIQSRDSGSGRSHANHVTALPFAEQRFFTNRKTWRSTESSRKKRPSMPSPRQARNRQIRKQTNYARTVRAADRTWLNAPDEQSIDLGIARRIERVKAALEESRVEALSKSSELGAEKGQSSLDRSTKSINLQRKSNRKSSGSPIRQAISRIDWKSPEPPPSAPNNDPCDA